MDRRSFLASAAALAVGATAPKPTVLIDGQSLMVNGRCFLLPNGSKVTAWEIVEGVSRKHERRTGLRAILAGSKSQKLA